jgi:hypothetical protein
MRFTSILLVAFLLSLLAAAQQSGDTASKQLAATPGITTSPQTGATSPCTSLSVGDPQMTPLAKVCEFAHGFRHSLPDFTCQQTTTSDNSKVTQAVVTYVNGKEHYSNFVVNGKPVTAEAVVNEKERSFLTSGEFGSDLVHLFGPPIAAEFKFKKTATLGPHSALVFEFQLPADRNQFWTIQVGEYPEVKPELHGELWVDASSDQLLRLKLEPAHLLQGLNIALGSTVIDYAEVRLGDAGVFLLPKSSEATVCVKTSPLNDQDTRLSCYRNAMKFHDCHKFGANTRIVDPH